MLWNNKMFDYYFFSKKGKLGGIIYMIASLKLWIGYVDTFSLYNQYSICEENQKGCQDYIFIF